MFLWNLEVTLGSGFSGQKLGTWNSSPEMGPSCSQPGMDGILVHAFHLKCFHFNNKHVASSTMKLGHRHREAHLVLKVICHIQIKMPLGEQVDPPQIEAERAAILHAQTTSALALIAYSYPSSIPQIVRSHSTHSMILAGS